RAPAARPGPPVGPCLAALRHSDVLPVARRLPGPSHSVSQIYGPLPPRRSLARRPFTGCRHTRGAAKLGARALIAEAHTRPPTASRMEFTDGQPHRPPRYDRQPLQAPRLRLPLQRDLRRAARLLGL